MEGESHGIFIVLVVVFNVWTRNALHVRDVGELGICIMGLLVLIPEIAGNEPKYSVLRFAAFSLFVYATCDLFFMMIRRSHC